MSELKRTAGPWVVMPCGNGLPSVGRLIESPSKSIGRLMEPGEQCFEAVCRLRGQAEKTDGNAQLIAAAPTLLAAAKMALNYLENHVPQFTYHLKEEIALLQAVIARATGEKP